MYIMFEDMRSDDLHRHIQLCMGNPTSKNLVEEKRRTSMNVPNDIAEKPAMNSKVQALLNEIINDFSTEEIGKGKIQSIPPQISFPAPPPDVEFWKEPLDTRSKFTGGKSNQNLTTTNKT